MNDSHSITAKVHELEAAMNKSAHEFQEKETAVESLKQSIKAAEDGIKACDEAVRQKTAEKREHERTREKEKLLLSVAERDMAKFQSEHRMHEMELSRLSNSLQEALRQEKAPQVKRAA